MLATVLVAAASTAHAQCEIDGAARCVVGGSSASVADASLTTGWESRAAVRAEGAHVRRQVHELEARRRGYHLEGPIFFLAAGVSVGAPVAIELFLWALLNEVQREFGGAGTEPFPFRKDIAFGLAGASGALLLLGGSWLAVTIVPRAKLGHQVRLLRRRQRALETSMLPFVGGHAAGVLVRASM